MTVGLINCLYLIKLIIKINYYDTVNVLTNPQIEEATENAGTENTAQAKLKGRKTQDWKMQHKTARVDNGRLHRLIRGLVEVQLCASLYKHQLT